MATPSRRRFVWAAAAARKHGWVRDRPAVFVEVVLGNPGLVEPQLVQQRELLEQVLVERWLRTVKNFRDVGGQVVR